MKRIVMVAPLAVLLLSLLPGGWMSTAQAQTGEPVFSPPLGFRDEVTYAPRRLEDADGNLIEDTNYGVMNPDLRGGTCFGIAWERLYHAGQDLYRTDGESTAGAEVTVAADGVVVYANPDLNYPGLVVMIEHTLAQGDKLYTVYAHLDDSSLEVEEGEAVKRGQRLGEVMFQAYSGLYPEHHPADDDSHLHFEVRRFLNARHVYKAHPACNGLVVGRGYTYPMAPEDFPAEGAGYVDPADLVDTSS